MSSSPAHIGAYKKVNVETASQGKLIILLFNGAIQRVEEAKRLLGGSNLQTIHNNLIRAQEIVTELRSALNVETGEVAQNLDRIYEYILHLLVKGNIGKRSEPLEEALEHLIALRDTWKEVFAKVAQDEPPKAAQLNQHGAAVMNLQG